VPATFFGVVLLSKKAGAPNALFYDNFSPNLFLTALAVFVGAKQLFSRIILSPVMVNVLKSASAGTFGVYLLHVFLIFQFERAGISGLLWGKPFLAVPLVAFLVFSLSLLFSVVLLKIPILRKIV